MKTALELYQTVRQQCKLPYMPKLRSGKIHLESYKQDPTVSISLLHYIKDFPSACGWLCYQSKTLRFEHQPLLPLADENVGYLLQGELYNEDNKKSLHIRQGSEGECIVTLFSEQLDNLGGLLETVSYIAIPNDETPEQESEKLYYSIYWEAIKNQGYQRCTSRFIGFKAPKQMENKSHV